MHPLIKILIFIMLFLILFSFLTFILSIRPRKIITNLKPSDIGLKYEEINFKSADGINLSGWFIQNNKTKKTIIIMHGYPADKANLLGIAKFLSKQFNVFLFDFRSFGKSKGKYTTVGYLEKKDLEGAIKYLEAEKNISEVGLYGFSLGGAVALMNENKNVKEIVSDSSYARLSNMVMHMYNPFSILKYPLYYLTKIYGLIFLGIDIDKINPVDNIKNLDVPILLIHSKNDSQIPVTESFLLHDANKKSELWIVENAEHGTAHFANPEEYEKKVLGFFEICLGPGPVEGLRGPGPSSSGDSLRLSGPRKIRGPLRSRFDRGCLGEHRLGGRGALRVHFACNRGGGERHACAVGPASGLFRRRLHPIGPFNASLARGSSRRF